MSIALIVAGAFAGGACATLSPADDPAELARTWQNALVLLPHGAATSMPWARRLSDPELSEALATLPQGTRFPTILYLHGCTGLVPSSLTNRDMYNLAAAGYAVIAPDSFARQYRQANCDPLARTGGLFPLAREFRQAEIRYAIARVRELPWVNGTNVFLMGFSEGGIAAAAYDGDEFRAHIITGWTCRAPSTQAYHLSGIWAPSGKPVLAIVGARDPWWQSLGYRGHCGEAAMRSRLESVVVDAAEHHVTWYPDAKRALLDFLQRYTSRQE